MIKNFKNLSGAALALALAALPGVAHAGGSAAASGTATLTVINQCSVSGTTVDLGSYLTTNTWGTVGAKLGQLVGTTYTAGTNGPDALNFGTINCDDKLGYNLAIAGTGTTGAIKLTINGKVMQLLMAVKKIGASPIGDSAGTPLPGTGAYLLNGGKAGGTGTGAAQSIFGSVTVSPGTTGSTAALTDQLGVANTYTDSLTYTLSF
ncbi:MAG: hypothetical protein RLZZ427_922 [Pseudomonadota bacterium]|jgi:hypothetical protein